MKIDDLQMNPRGIRLRDAYNYLGMDINRFNREVRPFIKAYRYGKQGVVFDRHDLDEWFDNFKKKEEEKCQNESQEFTTTTRLKKPQSTNALKGLDEFADALKQARMKTRQKYSTK